MNIDNLLNTFKNEIREVYQTYDGVGTTTHLEDRPKNKPVNYNLFTIEQLKGRKEYFNELIEKAKLHIDEIDDTIRHKKSVSKK